MQAVGAYLAGLRNDRGLTQREAAALIHVNAKTIERWEAGKHEPPLTTLQAYVRALNGSVSRAIDLLTSPVATGVLSQEEEEILSRLTPEQRAAVVAVARQMLRDP